MRADALREELIWLGFDERSWRALALLPLVDVAWADGTVQPEERALIEALATERYRLEPEGRALLTGWLRHRPTDDYLRRGRRALLALAHAPVPLAVATPQDVLALCAQVADAAGGVFGIGRTGGTERNALAAIAEGLRIENPQSWDAVFTDDDETTAVVDRQEVLGISRTPLPRPPRDGRAHILWNCLDVDTRVEVEDALGVGRARSNRLQIVHDAGVSRCHCVIRREPAGWFVEDLDSQNGTFVNGERVQRRPLLGGERIVVGSEELRFVLEG